MGAWLMLVLLGGVLRAQPAALQEYRYVEGEACAATEGSGLREEGFTSWMMHPSGSKVMVLAPGGWLEYRISGLADRQYGVYVRGLAWASGCETDVLWDGQPLGRLRFPKPGTALKWSERVGTVRGPGNHTLRLVADAAITQAPYLDAILLTTQDGYQPDDADRDFVSFTTALPLLQLSDAKGTRGVAPEPEGTGTGEAAVQSAQAGPLGIGGNEVGLEVVLSGGAPRPVTVRAGLDNCPAAEAQVALEPGKAQGVRLICEALQPGRTFLRVRLMDGERKLATGAYPVSVPDPVAMALEPYAAPVGTSEVVWRATLATRPEVSREVSAQVVLRAAGETEALVTQVVSVEGQSLETRLATSDLPRGAYVVTARLQRAGALLREQTLDLRVFDPVPNEEWEPARRTEAHGGVVLMNGRPFLGRLLYHSPPTAQVREQGFNLVQCYGSDPDPLESIQKHLDGCAESGIWGTVALFNNRFFLPGGRFDLEHLALAAERFRDHPALWAWDLIDEPEVSVEPAQVAEAADLLRRLDPDHLVWVNLCQPTRGLDYLDAQDLWSFDSYPIPARGPFAFEQWLAISDEHLRNRRPIGSVMQAYCGPEGRLPTPAELRCMTYLHLLHDYRWLGMYTYYDPEPAGCLARSPELWAATRALNSELRALEPVLLDVAPMEACATDATGAFEAGTKSAAGRRIVIGANGEGREVTVGIQAEGTRAQLLFEREREVAIEGGVLMDRYGPYAVHVYEVE